MNSEVKEIELRSEEISEILGKSPNWISRWGISLLLAICLLFLVFSWFIKYPDTIPAVIVVTNERPPATLVSKVQGKITGLNVKDGDEVTNGQVLAIIENPANYQDVLRLKAILSQYKMNIDRGVGQIHENAANNLILGGLQQSWDDFIKVVNDAKQYQDFNINQQKINSLQQEVKMTNLYYERLYGQKSIMEKDLKIGKTQFERDSALFSKKVISSADLERSEAVFLQKKYSYEGARVNLANTKIKLTQLEQEILDLKMADEVQKRQLTEGLKRAYNNILNQIETWEQNFLLVSPLNGKVTLTQFWSVNQNVKPGDKILTVLPDKQTVPIGRISMPLIGAGKVRPGQKVNIKFANFPYLEYGMVVGIVKSVSMVPNDNLYSVEVILPEGLMTNYGKVLPASHEIQGTAEIITDDIRIIQRLFNPMKFFARKNLR